MELFTPELLSHLEGKAEVLAQRLSEKSARIGVVGLGYVGLPIALEFAKKDFKVIGVDVSEAKVDSLRHGKNYIEDLVDEEVAQAVKAGWLHATTDFGELEAADVIYICVPTPFDAHKDPDLSYILNAAEEIAKVLREGQLIILKSTTFPGTTEEYLVPVLHRSGLVASRDYYVAFSPERVDPGNKVWHTGNTPIVTGGLDRTSSLLASWANRQIIEHVYMVSSPKVAELEKLLENIFRSVNIALVNEIARLSERIGGIDIWEAIDAAATKPFGFLKFTPGAGVGGHCIPVDPYYLSWLARKHDFETRFITLAANVNESMPYHVANLVIKTIARQPVSLYDARVLIVGASFKKNVRDIRNSVSEALILRLLENGVGHIDITDPWVEEFPVGDHIYRSVDMDPEKLGSYHCIVLATDHDDFDVEFIVRHAQYVVDTRNMTRNITEGREKIVVLGVSDQRHLVPNAHH